LPRGVNVGYSLLQDLINSGQLAPQFGTRLDPGLEKLVLSGCGNYRPRQEFADQLSAATDDELAAMCGEYIWLSAYAANNANSDYHWQVDACYYECQRRNLPEIYKQEHAQLVAENSR
jgi:hypothetical protein